MVNDDDKPEMSGKDKPARKRRPPTQLIVSEESKAALEAHLNSEEGQRSLDDFARIIADWAAKSMPAELLQALGARENLDTLKELWPDIVNAFFQAHSSLAPGK